MADQQHFGRARDRTPVRSAAAPRPCCSLIGRTVPFAVMSELLYEVSDHIATLTFNRPDQMNTISGPMLFELSKRLIEADRDPEVRVIVLTGNGPGVLRRSRHRRAVVGWWSRRHRGEPR